MSFRLFTFKCSNWCFAAALILSGCSKPEPSSEEVDVWIETAYGKMGLKLYDDAPKHKQQLVALTKQGLYKNSSIDQLLNNDIIEFSPILSELDTNFNRTNFIVEQEINAERPAKRGVLVAFRPDPMENPNLNSNLTRFYLVLGRLYTDYELDMIQPQIDEAKLEVFIIQYLHRPENIWINDFAKNLQALRSTKRDSVLMMLGEIRAKAMREWVAVHSPHKFSSVSRDAYKNKGGIPKLETQYTLVGEVSVGLDILDSLNLNINYLNFDTAYHQRSLRLFLP